MPIKKPSSELFRSIKLKTAITRVTGSDSRRNVNTMLNLTPMIDMFVVLVIFLLMTFSSSNEIQFIQKDIELPTASMTDELEQAPVVTMGTGQVVAEGKSIGNMDDIAEDENFEILELSEILTDLKNIYKQSHPNQPFAGKIVIQGDKEAPFCVLKKIMYTCAMVGYGNINFAVTPVGKSKEEV